MSIEEQFAKHIVDEEVKEMIEDDCCLALAIEDLIDYLQETRKDAIKNLFKNKTVKSYNKITSIIFGEDENEKLLDADALFLKEIIKSISENIEYLKRIKNIITKENFSELVKLVDFLVDQFIFNYSVLESPKIAVENKMRGITYVDGRESTISELAPFLENILSKYETNKELKKD